jgi:hypothetical protein
MNASFISEMWVNIYGLHDVTSQGTVTPESLKLRRKKRENKEGRKNVK